MRCTLIFSIAICKGDKLFYNPLLWNEYNLKPKQTDETAT